MIKVDPELAYHHPWLEPLAAKFGVCGLLKSFHPDIQLRGRRTNTTMDEAKLNVRIQVLDRDSGQPTSIAADQVLWLPHLQRNPEMLAEGLRAVLRYLMGHEVDEGIVVNGKRPFDPHANEPQR